MGFSLLSKTAAQNCRSRSLASVLLDATSTRWEQTLSPEGGSRVDAVLQCGVHGVRGGVNGHLENVDGQVLLHQIAPCWCEKKARM